MDALKAVKLAGRSIDEEKEWQNKHSVLLPPEIAELVKITLAEKEKGFNIRKKNPY